MLDIIKNILLTLSALAAVIGFYIKTSSNFFIETIKSKYKNIPGKQSTFEVITKWISYIVASIYVFVCILYLFSLFKGNGNGDNSGVSFRDYISISYLTGLAMALLFIYSFYCILKVFPYCQETFVKILENKSNEKFDNKYIRKIKLGITTSSIISGMLILCILITLTEGIDIVKVNGIYIFENNITDKDIGATVLASLIVLFSTTCFIVLNSLKEIYININNNIYKMYTNNDDIECKCYLEYGEYYLIFKEGVETYIKKSEVKKIIKKNEIEVMSSEEGDIMKNVKLFNKIHNPKLKKEYRNLREFIKQEYKSNKEYNDLSNIKLEIERLNNYVKMLNNPFISIIVSIGLVGIPLAIPEDYKNWLFIGVYGLILILAFGTLIIKMNDKFMIAIVSINVLDELKENFIQERKQSLEEKELIN